MNNGNGRQQVTPQAGAVVTQALDSTQLQVLSETSVQAAEVEAMVKARCVLARSMPRNFELVRQRILKDCQRPGFADKAVYSKPVGGEDIEGPSIRFAENAMRQMGNMVCDATIAEDTAARRRIRVSAMDLETNATASADVVIEKTVERKDSKDREVVGQRLNSWNKTVYIVLATEDELLNKTNNAVSKMRRNKILELVPADLVEDAMLACQKTMAEEDKKDPAAQLKAMVHAFSVLRVSTQDLEKYLGHALTKVTPQELAVLRKVHAGLRDGETTWKAVLDTKLGVEPKTPGGPVSTAPTAPEGDVDPPPASAAPAEDDAVAKLRAADEAAKAAAAAAAAPQEPATPQGPLGIDFSVPDITDQVKTRMQAVVDDPNGTTAQLQKLASLFEKCPKDRGRELGDFYLALRNQLKARKP